MPIMPGLLYSFCNYLYDTEPVKGHCVYLFHRPLGWEKEDGKHKEWQLRIGSLSLFGLA